MRGLHRGVWTMSAGCDIPMRRVALEAVERKVMFPLFRHFPPHPWAKAAAQPSHRATLNILRIIPAGSPFVPSRGSCSRRGGCFAEFAFAGAVTRLGHRS